MLIKIIEGTPHLYRSMNGFDGYIYPWATCSECHSEWLYEEIADHNTCAFCGTTWINKDEMVAALAREKQK